MDFNLGRCSDSHSVRTVRSDSDPVRVKVARCVQNKILH